MAERSTTGDAPAVGGATLPVLTIHIGASKTGTTAIQNFLMRNRKWLRKRGVVVPDVALGDGREVDGCQSWYFEQSGTDPAERSAELTKKVDALFARPGVRQVVISAENLSDQDSKAPLWFEDVVGRYETEIVIYLRRQDDYLLSSWQQWYAKIQPDLRTWLESSVGVFGNWQAVIQDWERIVGPDRVRVRLYERDRLIDGDVVADFAQFLRVDESIPDKAPATTLNPSFNEAVVSLVPGSGLFQDAHDNEFYDFLEEMLGPAFHKRPNESLLTYEERMELIRRYSHSNYWVSQRYFADSDVPPWLFAAPLQYEYRVPSEGELVREQMQMLLRLMFELHRRRGWLRLSALRLRKALRI